MVRNDEMDRPRQCLEAAQASRKREPRSSFHSHRSAGSWPIVMLSVVCFDHHPSILITTLDTWSEFAKPGTRDSRRIDGNGDARSRPIGVEQLQCQPAMPARSIRESASGRIPHLSPVHHVPCREAVTRQS